MQPKFGLLTIALEPYFDARVADVAICPLSLSYERTVEENLHVRELMGIPKPPESTKVAAFYSNIFKTLSTLIIVLVSQFLTGDEAPTTV